MRELLRGRLASLSGAGAVMAIAVLVPVVIGNNSYQMSIAVEVVIYALLVLTLNLLVGYGGQVSIGHAGLLGVGAYCAALLAKHLPGLIFPVELIAAGVATAVVGFLLGLPTGRLRGNYLAVVTLGFGVAVPQIANNLTSITGGYTGLTVGAAHINSLTFSTPVSLYYVALLVVGLSYLLIIAMLRSSTGRAFQAVRDSEAGAAAMGVNVPRAKVLLFTVSAFYAGIAGDLFAHYQGIVAPDSFPFSLSLLLLAAVLVGGLASIWGSVIGATLLVLVQNGTSSLPGESTTIVGGVVVILLLVSPGGLASLPGTILRRRRGRKNNPAGEPDEGDLVPVGSAPSSAPTEDD